MVAYSLAESKVFNYNLIELTVVEKIHTLPLFELLVLMNNEDIFVTILLLAISP